MSDIKEQYFEEDIVKKLEELGWENKPQESIKRNSDYRETIDYEELLNAVLRINKDKDITVDMAEKAIKEVRKINDTLENMNQQAWKMLTEGIKVFDYSQKRTISIKIISEDPELNSYWAVRQFEVATNRGTLRRPDVTLFVNGLPVVVMEVKKPTATEKVKDAWKQNESLKELVPDLWKFNVMNFISNLSITLYGSTTCDYEHMHRIKDMKTRDGKDAIEFLFSKSNFYQFITTFSYWVIENNKPKKYMAAPHQIEAVNATVNKLMSTNDNKGGLVWHTQGSGKSVTMLMLAKELLNLKKYPTATVILITDRKDLDDQLYKRFLTASNDYLRVVPKHIESRQELVDELKDKKQFGLYFTTVQKFDDDTNVLSDRDDIFILIDEAHRSQNNIDGDEVLDKDKKEVTFKYGFAYYMRQAFPNAKITGFTGTPLMRFDKNSVSVFGGYNHKYLMNDSVEDGTTVPINYEMRNVHYELNEQYLHMMDEIQKAYKNTLEEDDEAAQRKLDELLKSIQLKEIMENEEVIREKASDILKHWDKRKTVLHGKSMIVAFDRIAAYRYYKTLIELRPELKDQIILVMTDNNKDDAEMRDAIVPKNKLNEVLAEFRKPDSKYKIAIVVDMLLTGFDVPDLDTLYIDRILKWHNLMQAVARVNRTYEDSKDNNKKESGLIVDYIGIWKYLSESLAQYTDVKDSDIDFKIDDVEKAKDTLLDWMNIINDNYVIGINEYYKKDERERYDFIMDNYNKYLLTSTSGNSTQASTRQKNEFLNLMKKLQRCYKMAFSVLDKNEIINIKGLIEIKNLLTNNSIDKDENLQNAIEQMKEAAKNSVIADDSKIEVKSASINKNINEVARVMMLEAEQYKDKKPAIAIELMVTAIKANLEELGKTSPAFTEKASERLKKIINKAKDMADTEHMLEVIKELGALSDDVDEESKKPREFENDQLQAFFSILQNDEYLKDNESSEILREIAEKLVKKIREIGIDQYDNNPRVRSRISLELRKLLKNDYNYPPDRVGGISGLLIDQINEQIHLNKKFFEEKNSEDMK